MERTPIQADEAENSPRDQRRSEPGAHRCWRAPASSLVLCHNLGLHSRNSGSPPGRPKCSCPFSRSGPLPGFQHCPKNHLRRRKADLLRSRIQTASQRETPSVLRLSRDISSIDSDCRRTEKPKFAGHPFVPDEDLVDLRLDTFCGQDLSNQLHGLRVSRAVCHI